ncbi:MAG TPA: Rieske 2Fe-2S domain-containing protein [Xanthobacteraceae bacterium]|nr:Rieske 2Fe-2S domain-containing protein [Xanthobacteraceae bacterium]
MDLTRKTTPYVDQDGPSKEAIAAFYEGMLPFWHPVLASHALADKPKGICLLGRRLVLARLGEEILVVPDTCRHFQAQLSLGKIVSVGTRTALQCAYHGWTFGSGGQCVRIPQLPPARSIPQSANLPAFQVKERFGLIWVCLASTPKFPIPDFPEYDDAVFRKITLEEPEVTRASATRMIMGTLDDTHFPWVHEGILGDPNHPEPPNHRVWRAGNELVVQYETEQPASLITTEVNSDMPPAAVGVIYTDYVGMPNVIRLVKDLKSGRYVVWLAACPVDFNTTRNFWVFARNYDLEPVRDAEYRAMSARVRLQDKPIIESQRPWLIPPFWTHIEMPMGPGDLPLIEYQRWLQELGIATAI